MKLKRLLSVATLLVGALGINAQTDVTSTYLKNANFDDESSWIDANAAVTDKGNVSEVAGWTTAIASSWTGSATMGYGTAGQCNASAIPTNNPTGGTSGGALAISGSWGGKIQYTQEVNLPAGVYNISYKAYNAQTSADVNNKITSNLIGFIANDETSYYCNKTNFNSGEWSEETLTFTLNEPTTGKISVGALFPSASSSVTARLFIDGITITYLDLIPGCKLALQNEIDKAKSLEVSDADKEALNSAIVAAETTLANATTATELTNAKTALEKAEKIALKGLASCSYINPSANLLVNGNFDTQNYGWTLTNMEYMQNNQRPTRYAQRWQSGALNVNGSAVQIISDLPKGLYILNATVNAQFQSDQGLEITGATLNINDTKVNTSGPWTEYEVFYELENDGDITVSFAFNGTNANWVGVDDFTLMYYGEGTFEELKYTQALNKAKELATKEMSSSVKSILDAAITDNSNIDTTDSDAMVAATEALESVIKFAMKSVKSHEILALGTLPDNSIEGWTCTNSNTFHINTWSVEGNTDGTDMRTPFIENWVGKPGPLGAGTISYTMEGLEPGTYTVEARIRIYSESGAEPAGATYFANETSIDIAEGNHFEFREMKGIYDTYKVKCVVGEDGKLTFGVNITEPTFNWVAIKGIKVKDSSPSLGTPAITPENGSNVMLNEFAGVSISFPESFNLEDVSKENLTYTLTAQLINTTDDAVVATEEINGAYDATCTAFATTKLNANKTYKVVIPAGSIVLNDGTTDIYTNKIEYGTQFSAVLGTLKAGTYFIQNAESGRYLVGGNSWGTQASLHKHGIDFIVTLNNGKYNLDSKISNGGNNHFLGDNLYVDSGAFGWSIVMQEDGTYTISNGSNYLVENAGSSVLATATDGTAANARWNFISIEDVLKMAEYTTSEAPLDMTGFIMDYGFGRNNTRNSSWLGDDPAYRFDENGVYSNAEFYNKTFNLYQEITGLPKGTYMVKVQGYYRDGHPSYAAARHESGAENLNAVLYAVGKTSASTPLKSIFDADLANMTTTGDYWETSLGRVPHSMTAANYAFAAGMYEGNSVTVSVGSDGKLTIGIKQETAGANENWTIFDNFELYYLGSTDTKFRDAGETTYQLSDATALTNGETVEVDNAKIANGVVVSFPDAVVEQTWKSGFRAYTIVKEEGGTVYRLETNADENNILNVAKGLFKANRTYEVTIEHIDYLDYTRFCDEDPKFLALGFDGCDPMPLWSTDSWSSDRGSFCVTIKTDETVVEDNTSAAKQIVFVEGGEATGIEGINTETVSTEYFNLNGVRVAAPQKGLNIIKKRMADGSVKTLKVMVK